MSDFGFYFDRLPEPSARRMLVVTLVSVALAVLTCSIVLLISSVNPIDVYRSMLSGSLGDTYARTETLVKMTPLLLTGLAVTIAFRMQLWNIGAEGQLYLGAIFATIIPLFWLPNARGMIMIPAMLLMGFIGGAIWGAIPGILRAWFNANETITTLMLNYVAILLCQYLVYGPWRDSAAFGFPGTKPFPDAAALPNWQTYRVNIGLLFALTAVVIIAFVLRRTRFGFELSVIGDNPRAARYAGMHTRRMIVLVLALSGGLAGIAGMVEVAGIGHSLQRQVSPGYGYTAIIVA
ncbi:MAG TPA: ABC transporter permease, partial [Thermomicrobiales bacterium]|nr:ABC transporter permease [Thermomicrobiales bacterium]